MLIVETKYHTFKYQGEITITRSPERIHVVARGESPLVSERDELVRVASEVHDQFYPQDVIFIRGVNAQNI